MFEEIPGPIVEQKTFEQLAVLLLDGSGSSAAPGTSGEPKAHEIAKATRELIARLQASRYRDNFFLAVVVYDEKPGDLLAPTPISQVDEQANYNPLVGHGGCTAIGTALEHGYGIARQFLAQASESPVPRSAVLVLMTDGMSNSGEAPAEVADRIKAAERVRICATGYGRDGDIQEDVLRRIVTEPGSYSRTRGPEELRRFFLASVSQGRI